MNKLKLCVIFGGASSEHEISCRSAASVLRQADGEKYDIVKLAILRDGRQFLYNGSIEKIEKCEFSGDTENLIPAVISPCPAHHGLMVLDREKGTFKIVKIDAFLPIVHGENCEDGNLQGLLKLSGVPFVGCDNRSSAVCMDKSLTKALLEKTDIPMAKWHLFYRGRDVEEGVVWCEENLKYPIFVKPCGTGSSVGVAKAENREEFLSALEAAFRFDEKVLAEETIVGSEVEVAVLQDKNGLLVSLPGELIPGSDFYDYDDKYKNDTASFYIPARLNAEQTEEVRRFAEEVFVHLDCRNLSRVDFFKTENGFVFNEINTLPGFTSISMYPKLIENMGVSYTELIDRLVSSVL